MTAVETTTWHGPWREVFGISSQAPEWVVAICLLGAIYLLLILPSGGAVSFLSRKIGADLQARVGPNRVGPIGIFQPFADLFKLLQKQADLKMTLSEKLWLGIHTMALYSTVAVLPLGTSLILIDTEMSAFLPYWATLVLALGTMLLGLSQKTVPGWFGGIRIASQALAGALPALAALMSAGLRSGSFRWSEILSSQGASVFSWGLFAQPFELISFFCFVASGMVVMGVAPLDGGLSVQDINGGVSSHLHGTQLALFRLGRHYGFFLWSAIAAVLFLGGANIPASGRAWLLENSGLIVTQLVEASVLLVKAVGLMISVSILAWVTPKIRSDQITDFAWKVLSPFSLFALAGTAIWMVWRH